MAAIEIEEIAAGKSLHHPEMGPTTGQDSVDLSTADDLFDTEQCSQAILRVSTQVRVLPQPAETAGATGTTE